MGIHWIGNKRIIKVALVAIIAGGVLGLVVMLLWNHLVPSIIGWHAISYFQALGLLILCKILFGSFHGRRTSHMTPEERDKFREALRSAWRSREGMGGNG
jgi:hypothetical protein